MTVGGVDYRPAGAGAFLPEDELVKLKRIFWRNNIVAFAPFLYVPASVSGQRVVLIGTWFEKPLQVDKSEVFATGLKKLHPAWKVEGEWPDDEDLMGVLVGRRLAARLGLGAGRPVTVALAGDSSLHGDRAWARLHAGGQKTSLLGEPHSGARGTRDRRAGRRPGAGAARHGATSRGTRGESAPD